MLLSAFIYTELTLDFILVGPIKQPPNANLIPDINSCLSYPEPWHKSYSCKWWNYIVYFDLDQFISRGQTANLIQHNWYKVVQVQNKKKNKKLFGLYFLLAS